MALFMKRNAAPRDGTAVQKKGNLYWHKVIAQDEAKFKQYMTPTDAGAEAAKLASKREAKYTRRKVQVLLPTVHMLLLLVRLVVHPKESPPLGLHASTLQRALIAEFVNLRGGNGTALMQSRVVIDNEPLMDQLHKAIQCIVSVDKLIVDRKTLSQRTRKDTTVDTMISNHKGLSFALREACLKMWFITMTVGENRREAFEIELTVATQVLFQKSMAYVSFMSTSKVHKRLKKGVNQMVRRRLNQRRAKPHYIDNKSRRWFIIVVG
jgi:hypothetical protein